ncbi:hypothetical protein LCGC14_1667570 [marine sediment metagenome]|uniref:Fibronectin type-III domain-containing protein n=1 Tax=marine sediment metagenome TaxID=412755 RepID=A0A0F9IEU7_9ZZZZ
MALATAHYQMVQTIDGETNFNLTDKYGAFGALLHSNVTGLGTESSDLHYVTPPSGGVGETFFRIDTPPKGFSSPIMKVRWLTTSISNPDGRDIRIVVVQGELFGGVLINQVELGEWIIPAAEDFADIGVVVNTWYTQIIPFNLALVTSRSDLWVNVSLTRGNFRVSWAALQVSFPYSQGETPVTRNYANGLTPIDPPPSVRAVGTTGSTRYCFRVVPCNALGCGPSSEEVIVTDLSAVALSNGNAILSGTNFISLVWDDVPGATFYKVYRTCGPGGLGLVATVLPDLGEGGVGGGGLGITGYQDDGVECVTDCDEIFNPGDFVGCQGVDTIVYPAAETP